VYIRHYYSTKYNLLLCLTIVFFSSCGGYKFQKSETVVSPLPTIAKARVYKATSVEQVTVLQDFPTDKRYAIIGKCSGTAYNGGKRGKDGSYDAFKRLKKCACENGGNAIVLTDKEEVIDPYSNTSIPNSANSTTPFNLSQGPRQVKVKITGYVIYMQSQALAIDE
jgi:hypothetical protein